MSIELLPTPQAGAICAILAPSLIVIDEAAGAMELALGPQRERSDPYPFNYTSYYAEEMGAELIKQLIWFERPVALDQLPEMKRRTMEAEVRLALAHDGRLHRRANIDPGLVTAQGLNLATTKFSGHRICIAPGLYAETTLLFHKRECTPFEWTYGDYRSEIVTAFLLRIRASLLADDDRGAT